mmetsp:Transcript_78/g.138  ORF Transcript_78/g.138 Transcript_78/m.138 type:complete len:81 (+) Transcript_78:226-468(+)
MDGPGEYEQHYAALQQQMWVQGVVSEITDTVFTRCIQGKPEESLSGRDVACIHSTVGKLLDTNIYMITRMAKKLEVATRA